MHHSFPVSDWELRQKHTTFFQAMLGSVQQGAISANTASAVIVTLGGIMAKFSDVLPSQGWIILLITVVAWIFLTGMLVTSFSRSAVRIETAYLLEHEKLFPNTSPYHLESFLLDFADKNPFLTGKRTRAKTLLSERANHCTKLEQEQQLPANQKATVPTVATAGNP